MSDEVIPLAGIALPMVLVPTILVLKQIRLKREWEHWERMRAMELGQSLPGTDKWPAIAAIAIGAGVPVGAFFCSWLAVMTAHAADEVFIAATFVGLGGVWGGTSLMKRLVARRELPAEALYPSNGKPANDPDVFDVVGRRG
jgi:hypothetical protein